MWPFCDANSPWWLLIPLLLGLLTGWWAWANRRAASDSDEGSSGIGSAVGGAIGAAGAGIAGAADAVTSGVSDAADTLSSGVSGAVDATKSGVSGAVDAATGAVSGVAAGLAGAAGAVASGVAGAVDDAKLGASGAVAAASGAVGGVAAGVAGAAGAVASGVAGAVDDAKSGVSGAEDTASTGVADTVDSTKSRISGAVDAASDGAAGAADAVSAGVSGAVDKADDLATNGAAAVAAAGATAAKTKRAAKSATADSDGDGTGTAAMPLVGDGVSGAAAAGAIGIAAAVGDPDDLLQIKGIGPKLNALLNRLGVTRFDQIAAWSDADVAKVDAHMEDFQGRIGREEWIPQAKLLATGQNAEWQRLYGTAADAVGAAGAVALTAIGIPAAIGDPDNLLQIKGIGPKLNALLISLGVTRFDQIAAWGAAEIDKVDDHLGSFKSRIGRDGWVEQAGLLATGRIAEFEAKFGKLDSENK